MKTAIGIDLGGTNVKGVLLNENGEILKQHYLPTQDDPDGKWRANILTMADFLKKDAPSATIIGLSCPGLANESNKCIAHLPNRLAGLENFIWENYLGMTTFVLNDAHAAMMAEARFGAVRGHKNAILLTLGTGVGGGLLINGALYQGSHQMAGHFGHICINTEDDETSILGMAGSLEYALGNYSIKRRSAGRFQSTHELLEAYNRSEAFATWLWLDSLRKLGLVIASFANSLSPEVVVLAGGITKAGEALFKPLQEFVNIYEFKPNGAGSTKTLIKQATFSDLSGAIGAAAFAFEKS
ncbi:MAG: ROK family protein [Thermoflexibacter sp.]|jgi:glucokinase|nr:ROK family protein [Thermoflexibacter sp.]